MKPETAHLLVANLLALLLAACGTSGSPNTADPTSSGNAGSSGCIDRSMAVGIEGGGLRRLLGTITSIGSDGTVVVGCQRVAAAGAVVVVDGASGSLDDLRVGHIVEIFGNIDPESGNLRADRITSRALPGSHGRYVGIVTIGGVDYFADALLTVDGAVRLYVGGPDSASGALQLTRPSTSAQLVGNVQMQGNEALGSGVIIGQGCAAAQRIRFCDETGSAELSLVVDSEALQGEIQVSTSAGDETWLLELAAWSNYYLLSAAPSYLAGQYREELAEFNVDADMIMSIDAAGVLFFQSAQSGCTGNATLVPHLDGAFNVYDVELTLASCTGSRADLNGVYEGLATTTPGAYWDYDSLLRVWLSKPDGATPQTAVTLLGSPL